jgi:hypothetical protein
MTPQKERFSYAFPESFHDSLFTPIYEYSLIIDNPSVSMALTKKIAVYESIFCFLPD